MFRLAKWLPCVAALAGAVMLGTASPARADIELELTISTSTGSVSATYDFSANLPATFPSTTPVPAADITSSGSFTGGFAVYLATNGQDVLEFSGSVGGYSVSVSTSTTNAPGSSTGAFVNTDNSSVSGSGTGLTITTSAETFNNPISPPAPALLLSTNSSVTGNSDTTTVTYTGSAGSSLGGSQYSSAGGSYTVEGSSASGSGPSQYGVFNNVSSYTLTDTLTLSSGDVSLDVSGKTQVTAVPEPATMMTAFAAMPFLGLGAWLRRRKQVAIA